MTTPGPIPFQITSGLWPASNENGYTIHEAPSKDQRPMKIIAVGAGISGIALADKVREFAPGVELKIYEQAEEVGGNWFWNRYPGIACDNPGVSFQFHKKPKTDWTSYYASGPEILNYFQNYAKENDLEKYMKFNTRVKRAEWDEVRSKWVLRVEDLKEGREWDEEGDVFVNAGGTLHHPKFPELKNFASYKGIMCHTARYPKDLDLKGKKVAVLGTGGSGVQILPAILYDAEKIYHWNRQPTYIMPSFGPTAQFKYTEEEKQRFATDSEYYLKYRKSLEAYSNTKFGALFLNGSPESQGFTQYLRMDMTQRLATRPEIAKKLIPTSFSAGCRRLSPGPGYLEALCSDKVQVFTEELMEMTEKGFKDAKGVEHEVDVFICATGFDTSFKHRFPIIAHGKNLQDAWASDPDVYLSFAAPGFPNYFQSFGPYGPTAHGSAVPLIEVLAKRFVDLVKHMSTRQILSMTPSLQACRDYKEHCHLLLRRTVFMESCNSWWKPHAPVFDHSGKETDGREKESFPMVFPGSRLAFVEAIEDFRAEDWEYTYESKK